MIDLQHQDCGGWFHSWAIMGSKQGFRCEKCKEEVWAPAGDAESKARADAERAAWMERLANLPPYEPPPIKRRATPREALIITAYEQWSEDYYAAGFLDLGGKVPEAFIKSIENYDIRYDHEEELLNLIPYNWPDPAPIPEGHNA